MPVGRGAAPRLLAHRDGGARLGDHRDRRLRGADRDRHPDAARLRARHRGRPRRRPARGDAGPAGGAGLGGERRSRPRPAPLARPRPAHARRRATGTEHRATREPERRASRARAATRSASGSPSSVADRGRDRRTRSAPATTGSSAPSAAEEGDAAAASSRCPSCSARTRATRTSSRTTARRSATRVRRTTGARPPARSSWSEVIRVCDLFDKPLVISFWFTRGADCLPTPGRRRRGRPALRRPGELPLDQRPRRARGGARDRAASAAGGSRSAGTPTARSPTSTGSAAARRVAFAYPGGILDARPRSAPRRSPRSGWPADDRASCSQRVATERARPRTDERRGAEHAARRSAGSAAELREEFPGLALRYARRSSAARAAARARSRSACGCSPTASPARQAINMRQQPIPWAYRVFFRHIGLDPDRSATPVEELALERMKQGGFRSQNLLDDALTIAIDRVGRRRCAPSTPTGSTGRWGSARASPARRSRAGPGELPSGHPGDRRRGAPAGAAVRRDRGRAVASTRRPSARCWSAVQVEGVPDDRGRGGAVAGRRACCRV